MALRHLSMLVLSTAVAATALALLLGACGGDGEEAEFRQARLVPTQFKGSGDAANESAAVMTVVDGVKQWDGPPVGLTGGLLIAYKDEYRATVRMETLGGQPTGDRQIFDDQFRVTLRQQFKPFVQDDVRKSGVLLERQASK